MLVSVVIVRKADPVHPHRSRLNNQVLLAVQNNLERRRVRRQATSVLDKVQLLLQSNVVHRPLGSGSRVRSHVLRKIRKDDDTRRCVTVALPDHTHIGEARIILYRSLIICFFMERQESYRLVAPAKQVSFK